MYISIWLFILLVCFAVAGILILAISVGQAIQAEVEREPVRCWRDETEEEIRKHRAIADSYAYQKEQRAIDELYQTGKLRVYNTFGRETTEKYRR